MTKREEKIKVDMNGEVKWYNKENQYGFIICDDIDEEVFFHKSQVISSITLQSGDKVSFDLVKFKGKYQARQVVYVATN